MIREVAWSNALIALFLLSYVVGMMMGVAGLDADEWEGADDRPEDELAERMLTMVESSIEIGIGFGATVRPAVHPVVAEYLMPVALLLMLLPYARQK